MQAVVNVPEKTVDEESILFFIQFVDLENQEEIKRMLAEVYGFGLTFGEHTRNIYNQLEEGWVTTPTAESATDVYMWRKRVSLKGEKFKTIPKIIALNLQKPARLNCTQQKRYTELERYFEKLQDRDFRRFLKEYPIIYFSRKIKILKSRLRANEQNLAETTNPRPEDITVEQAEDTGFD